MEQKVAGAIVRGFAAKLESSLDIDVAIGKTTPNDSSPDRDR